MFIQEKDVAIHGRYLLLRRGEETFKYQAVITKKDTKLAKAFTERSHERENKGALLGEIDCNTTNSKQDQ